MHLHLPALRLLFDSNFRAGRPHGVLPATLFPAHLLGFFLSLFLFAGPGQAGTDTSPSPTSSITGEGPGWVAWSEDQRGDCGELLFNADGTYEGGYGWQYGGVVAPDYGSFAERYARFGEICGIGFDFTQTGNDFGQLMDVYVWEESDGLPGAVVCVQTGVDPGPIAFWPSLSRHFVAVPDCTTGDFFWVGYWGDWPNDLSGWFIGSDLDGFGGFPYTKVPPGIGYPTGWQNVSVIWGPTQALGIGAYYVDGSLVGACCFDDGSCLLLTSSGCTGFFVGPTTSCDPNPCSQLGACCFGDGSCRLIQETECTSLQGSWLGDPSCEPNPCEQPAACCFRDGQCQLLLSDNCDALGGTVFPDEPTCEPNPCPPPPPGACCYTGGYCLLATEFTCDGGDFQGENTACEPNPCLGPGIGACCYADGQCRLRTEELCAGYFQGAGTSCSPSPCISPAPGACCFRDGSCEFLTEFGCAVRVGDFAGEDTNCAPNPCPQPVTGACCLADASCLVTEGTGCAAAGGEFQGENSACDPNPCTPAVPGACCLALGVCEISTDRDCPGLGGEFQGADSACAPNPCPEPCVPFDLAGRPSTTKPAPPSDPFSQGAQSRRGTGPNYGGTLVLHADPAIVYTADRDYCGDSNITSCGNVVNRADTESIVVAHVLAFFPVSGSPRLSAIVFGLDFPDCVELADWEGCGDFELPEGDWPEPGTGTALTWAEPRTGLVTEVYWFAAQGYAAEPGELALVPHPTQGAFFANDGIPAILDDIAALGSLGFFRNGVTPCPGGLEPIGACCFEDGSCTALSFPECEAAGGILIGIDTPCDPTPCPDGVAGACCFPFDGSCEIVNEIACEIGGGYYLGDESLCDPNPCGNITFGACCFSDQSCLITGNSDCIANEGWFRGPDTVCDPDPCPPAGACCLGNSLCVVVFETVCANLGGEFQGDAVPCEGTTCASPGACCFEDGSCQVLGEDDCVSSEGQFLGSGLPCDPNPCQAVPTIEESWGRVKERFRGGPTRR